MLFGEHINNWQVLFIALSGFVTPYAIGIFICPRLVTRMAEYFYILGRKSAIKTIATYRAIRSFVFNYFGKNNIFSFLFPSFSSKLVEIASEETTTYEGETRYYNVKKEIRHKKHSFRKNNKKNKGVNRK